MVGIKHVKHQYMLACHLVQSITVQLNIASERLLYSFRFCHFFQHLCQKKLDFKFSDGTFTILMKLNLIMSD